MRTVHVVGIVQESLRYIHGAVILGYIAVRLDADEVYLSFLDDLAQTIIRTNLKLQLIGRKIGTVITDLTTHRFQPGKSIVHFFIGDAIASTDDVLLLDVFHIDTKKLLPLLQIGNRRVHTEGTSAEIAKCKSTQTFDGSSCLDIGNDLAENGFIVDRTPNSGMFQAKLLEGAGGCQHSDHTAFGRMKVGEQDIRSRSKVRGYN